MEGPLGVTNQLAALLVASDPRGAADRTLDFLISLNKARGAAVFALYADRLNLFTGRGFDVETVAAVQTAWNDGRAQFIAGEILQASNSRAPSPIAPLIAN